ncbi:MAG TPA: ATP-binding protein, partial [Candidatus Acidoferrales bacterium]|nr:ATP-binding protein [Candidatus Acidoferrales bacterium]
MARGSGQLDGGLISSVMTREAQNKLVDAIEAALLRAGLRRGSTIVVGLSGGADSVALTSTLLELRGALGLRIVAAHLNHRIRGPEADRDEEYVRAMCARLGIELIVERADGLDASTSSANLEERARDMRRE